MKRTFQRLGARLLALTMVLSLLSGSALAAENRTAVETLNEADAEMTGEWVTGELSDGNPADYYNVELPDDGWLNLRLQGITIQTASLKVLDADETTEYVVKTIQDSSSVSPKTTETAVALTAGSYKVRVGRYAAYSSGLQPTNGTYRVQISFQPANNNEQEPNNSFDTAMPLPEGQKVTGFLAQNDDLEFYRLELASTQKVRVNCTAMYYAWMEIRNGDLEQLKKMSAPYSTSETSPKTLTYEAELEAGTYYVRVSYASDYEKSYGRYILSWESVQDPSNPNPAPEVPDPAPEVPDEPTPQPQLPAAPAAPTLTGVANSSKGIQVKWNRVSGANGYRVFRKAGSSKSWKAVATVNASTSAYVDQNVSNGTKYVYTVRPYAKNSAGTTWGKYNSKGLTIIRLATSKLSSAKSAKAQQMTLKWARNSKASGYQVQYATNSKFSGAKAVKISGNKNVSRTISKLAQGKRYYVRVRSYRTYGGKNYCSGWSNVRYVTIQK